MAKSDWRKEEEYTFTSSLDEHGWAWEFLRRNPNYWASWEEYESKAKQFQEKFGDDWFKVEETKIYLPPKQKDETEREWSRRCIESEPEFEVLSLLDWHVQKWGLASRLYDPECSYDELKRAVRFFSAMKFPKLISDPIELQGLLGLFDPEKDPFPTVDSNLIVVAFDLQSPANLQLEKATQILARAQTQRLNKIPRNRNRHEQAWNFYLRVLDAHNSGEKPADFGMALTTAETNEYPEFAADNSGRAHLKRAQKQMDNYRSILRS